MFSIIAAVGKNRALGKGNSLVFHIKEDMRFFRDKTLGHRVVMGRKTWESLPHKLSERENLVVSRGPVDGADVTITDLSQFIDEWRESPEEIFVVGGGNIYRQFLPYAKVLYLTEVDASPEADVFFPEFNAGEYKREVIKMGVASDPTYKFVKYTRNKGAGME